MRLFPLVLFTIMAQQSLQAQDRTYPTDYINDRILEAIAIVTEKQASERRIPKEILERAEGLGIIEITRGGFGVGGQHGSGVLLAKNNGKWSAPIAFSASGGSIGFQIGLEVKKLIYVLNTKTALEAFTQDEKVKLSAVANATAGPDHVAQDANTMAKYDVYVYSLSEGAFAGAAVGGEVVGIDTKANARTYGKEVTTSDLLAGKVASHPVSKRLYSALGEY